jgi:hypothetical protein
MKSIINANQEKMDAWLKEMKAWRKETMAFQEKAKVDPEKMKASLEEIEAVEETGLEEMKARMDVFEGKLDKMDTARKACL